jgi:rubrerythrin
MKSLKGTQTEKNLLAAFAGESQARNRYTYFAAQAQKEGFEYIAAIFLETANHEREHARRFFGFLEGGDVEITASYPAGKIGTSMENLKAAAEGEYAEHSSIYPKFAEIAKEEGFPEVAAAFRSVAIVEKYHEARYRKLLKKVEEGKVFKSDKVIRWRCLNCGYIHEGKNPPQRCPACQFAEAFFEPLCEEEA